MDGILGKREQTWGEKLRWKEKGKRNWKGEEDINRKNSRKEEIKAAGELCKEFLVPLVD